MLDLDPPDTIVIEPNCPVCGESVPIMEEMWTRAQEEGFP
jgi:adenine-specific DNA methylase